MGKPKKGKRTGKDEDFDSDVDIEEQSQPELAKAKSKAKDKKKKKGEEVDDLIDDFDELKVDKSRGKKGKKGKRGDDDSDDESVSIASKGKGRNQDSDSEAEMKSRMKNKKGKKASAAADADSDTDDDAPKVKAKAKKKREKRADDSDDESEPEVTKVKGKNKKGKRGDEEEEEILVKETKGKKKGRKKDEDTEEDVPKPKGKTKKGRKDDISDEDIDIPITASKSKGKPVKSGFALLDIEGDDDDVDEAEEPPPSDDESEKMQSVERPKGKQSQQKQEGQSKKGKKKKKKDDSDDEIEKALAELEMEYSGKKVEKKEAEETPVASLSSEPVKDEKIKKGKDKKPDKSDQRAESESKDDINEVDEGSTVKTAAQKKKEKKERERLKKLAQKKAEGKQEDVEMSKEGSVEKTQEQKPEALDEAVDGDDEEDGKKKKKKKGTKEDPKDKGKGPGKKMITAMQEALKKLKEDEERAKREEEERILQEEAREKARLEQLQLEQERKEKKKLKEKQRKERLKAEGKLLTNKQKQDRARAQAMLEALKAQGMEIPEAGEKKPKAKLGTRIRPNKLKQQTSTEDKEEKKDERKPEQVEVEIVDEQLKIDEKKHVDEVKDTWDADSSEGEHEEDKSDEATKLDESKINDKKEMEKGGKKESSDSESVSGSETESEEDEESEEDSVDDKLTDAEKKREKARLRIQNRRIEAEKKKSLDNLRAAVVCVLGHVDTGKTKILDKLRRTNVQDGEAGGITQQIGATNVPIEAIQDSTRHVKDFADKVFKIPGLLIIDTPGHESFSNLRNRGSSLCDIAVLVVDIMHGLEPQTIESIGLLKTKKCPFIVALNKIDRLYDWQTMNRKDVHDIIKTQGSNTQREFEKRSKDVILQFAEQGLNAALFYENPDPRSYVSLVPTSAITGEGMGNLLALLVDACQGPLAKRLMYSEELQATVLEVKALPGLGTTIDCILVNGTLREGDTMIVAGTDGPIVTQIRSLLMPQPLKELRVKNAYKEHREVKAAQGVKIAAKDLEKAIAGLNLAVAQKPDEVELMKEEIAKELSKALGNIKLAERGVFVQASTLGALEALLDFLKSSKIPYAGIRIGPVVKKDVMKASIMLEHDSQYATILAFDVKIERDAQELADSLGVKIFQADIIYHLFDKFTAYREELKQRKRDEHKHIAVFPCKLRVLPQYIFNSRDPIVMGVMVEAGIVKEGTPVCVPSKDFVDLGIVTSIEYNHKAVETARKGQEVCIKIEPVPGEAPKMFGRHFEDKDMIVSKITRQSIDACKDYFRDDLVKTDWQLMLELKKLFQILSNSGSCESNSSSPGTTRRIKDNILGEIQQLRNQGTPPPPPSLAPPHYPAPPRPPSRNGGDEARVARAVSGHANGVSRGLPSPRAGWSVRAGPSTSPSPSSPPSPAPSKSPSPQIVWSDGVPIQCRNTTTPSLPQHTSTSTQTIQPAPSTRQVPGTAARWQERLELRGTSPLMTPTGLNPPSRPPSSASSGGSTSNLPRVHGHDHTRPLPPPRLPEQHISTIVPITAPLTPLSTSSSFRSRLPMTPLSDSISSRTNNERNQIAEVTLTVPRPDVERAVNEYVETPFRQSANAQNPKCLKNERRHHHHHHHQLQQQHQQHLRELQQNTSHQQKSDSRHPRRHQQTLLQSSPNQQPVTKQPVSFTKEPSSTIVNQISGLRQNDPSLSIMCDYCGKCKCESCREPSPLPSRWLCNNTCFCSAETALDYASCLCCVKGLFYHCGDNGSGAGDSQGGASCADEPCSCSGNRKNTRWACLAALTMVLPCLLCYWPLKGCVTICETCYARHAAHGCRCDPNSRHHNNDNNIVVTRDSRDPEKRLLDPVTPEL